MWVSHEVPLNHMAQSAALCIHIGSNMYTREEMIKQMRELTLISHLLYQILEKGARRCHANMRIVDWASV